MADAANSDLVISKDTSVTLGMDYAFLREIGIGYIQSLASDIWTDYNIHDPGVTILEVLAYAITDISSRASNSVGDLLASKPGALPAEKDFFSAAEILPCSPVTLNDFRKLLIDHADIRNAWLTKSTDAEQAFYFNSMSNQLTYEPTTFNGDIIIYNDKIVLNGLYNVLLEFEPDELNSSVVSINGTGIEAAFPFWDEISPAWTKDLAISGISTIQFNPVSTNATTQTYFVILKITYTGGSDQFGVTVAADLGIAETDIKNKLEDTAADSLIKLYNERIIQANIILDDIRFYLNSNRNIGEDFYAFKATRIQEIAISVQLEVSQGLDLVSMLAEVFYRLDKFLSPQIQFYTLEEMLAVPGKTIDEIFEGPLLQHGFIDDNELIEIKRNNTIYTSDLLGIIMSLNNDFNYGNLALASQNKGIIAVKNLTISNYINNQLITDKVKDCLMLTLTDIYKPRLSIDKSAIRITRNSVEINYLLSDVIKAFNTLKTNNAATKFAINSDVQIPVGSNLFVQDYYSIRNDFPVTYGVGKAGLPASSGNERVAQANQLKGFLLFFDQLLANYLSQLAHVKDLFSINAGVDNTYFWQSLKDIIGNDALHAAGYEAGITASLENLEDEGYGINRRNNFLDHLLARFGEDFSEYALLIYAENSEVAPALLTTNKSDFLKNYANLGCNRSKSFNYLSTDNWNTDNVAWLKRRICGLLGLGTYQDVDLASNDDVEGFHLVENILLRPKLNSPIQQDVFFNLNITLDADGNVIQGTKDPYSFRLVFVFPGWHTTGKFADPDFTNYIEKVVQRETPAHILAQVCWITDIKDTNGVVTKTAAQVMTDFETAFKNWLTAMATQTDPLLLSSVRNNLVDAINVFI